MSNSDYPKVFVSHEHDFASVKLSSEIEAKSYLKNGLLVSEDQSGKIIEVQILNLSDHQDKSESAS